MTPVEDPGDFDANALVEGMLSKITFEGTDSEPSEDIG
jgi:hypothetical protein